MILYGAPVKEKIKVELIAKVKSFAKKPQLFIVQVGDRPDSNLYIKNKIKFGEEIGVSVALNKFDQNISQTELEQKIKEIVEDKEVDGVIVQLPLPENIDSEKIINLLPKNKDADGLTTSHQTPEGGEDALLVTPATARAVMALLDFYEIDVKGKRAAVIGRSRLAGGPIAQTLEERGASVTVCHRETENIKEICKDSEILISAAGSPGLVTKDFVNKNQVVVDVGINKIEGKFVGDVDFAAVEQIVAAITPVPGGIGPLTVACLFQNLLDLVSIK